jgi:hypothetical protein
MSTRQQERQRDDAFAGAAGWLADLAETRDELRLSDLLRLLFGLWLCDRVLRRPASLPGLVETARRVDASLRQQAQANAFDPLSYDATLLFMTARILRAHGLTTPAIDTFAHGMVAAFNELPHIPLHFVNEAVLLARLGFQVHPPVPLLTVGEIEGDALTLLRMEKDQLRVICVSLDAATHYGRYPARGAPELLQTLRLVMPPILLETMRLRDLDTGARLLRAMRYLRLTRTRAVRAAVTALIGQQQPGGKFGYFTALAGEVSRNQAQPGSTDLDLGLHLPITVSCVWALAETTVPGFSVLDAPRKRSRVASRDAGEDECGN